jgi:hypothetical protein
MTAPSAAAVILALSRIGFGAGYLVAPGSAGSWVGRTASKPGGRVLVRALGARDLALAGGALRAVLRRKPKDSARWMLAQAVADGADLAATLAERDRLSRSEIRLGNRDGGRLDGDRAAGRRGIQAARRARMTRRSSSR